jgi:hypothetical protein
MRQRQVRHEWSGPVYLSAIAPHVVQNDEDVDVGPGVSLTPRIGAIELAAALARPIQAPEARLQVAEQPVDVVAHVASPDTCLSPSC